MSEEEAAMAVTPIGRIPVAVIAASASASAAPDDETDGFLTTEGVLAGSGGGTVRTLITYTGDVTAANVRLWVRDRATGVWYRGMDTDTLTALTPEDGNDARDWVVGEGVEFTFQLVSIEPSGGVPTVAVHAVGVSI